MHDYRDSDWVKAIAPALWSYQVVDEAEPFSADVAKALWECSGGLPGYARRLITEVQKTILFGVEKSLSAAAIRRQYLSLASFRQFRPLIEGLTTFNEQKLVESGGEDIPISQFVKRWASLELLKTESDDADEGKEPPKPKMGDSREHISRKKAQKKSAATKRRRKTDRNAALQEQIPTDDLRFGENIKDALARGLSELKDDIATDSDSKQKSKKKT